MTCNPIKLDLGCGEKPRKGHTGIDRKTNGEVYPLSYPDDSVDSITASHVLEHFGHGRTLHVLKEWVRVLKPGGTIRIAVPDFDKIIAYYQSTSGAPVEGYLMGGQTDANDAHGAIFNEDKLRELLRTVGIRSVKRWKSDQQDCAALPVSLNLEGVKRGPASLKNAHGILSAPRLCFTDQAMCMAQSLHKLHMPIRIRQGVFWGQTMTGVIKICIEEGAEYILSMDYDSLFTPEDIDELLWLAQNNPDADAICAMQMGRDRDTLLITAANPDGSNKRLVAVDDLQNDLLPIRTGHFGLTIIKVASLHRMEKPWFVHAPDKDGEWGDGRVDEDIHFWRAWEKAGNKLHQANRVVIGHMQLVATWPNQALGPVHQLIGDYRTSGKPEGTWR